MTPITHAAESGGSESAIPPDLLREVVTTEVLRSRRSRKPNHASEAAALLELADAMVASPVTVLDKVANLAMQLCGAGSAGVSVLEETEAGPVFRWRGLAGLLAPFSYAKLHAAMVETNRQKDMFLAVLGHELRDPLSAISMALYALNKQAESLGLNVPARGIIERQVEHMVRLVNELLDLTRASAGKLELRKQNVAVREVLDRAIEMCQAQLTAHAQSVSATLGDNDVRVLADSDRLCQVFSNLLTNAAKFSTAPGNIFVSSEVRDGHVAVRVRDFGIGIPPDRLDSIFNMFTQLATTGPARSGGLGIGLAIARQIVQMHGGIIRATSAGEGHGSEFTVTLPIAEGPALQR